jgi:hypothetical protein
MNKLELLGVKEDHLSIRLKLELEDESIWSGFHSNIIWS